MKKSTILIIGTLFILSLFFFACEEEDEGMSVQERVENFLSDLNSDTTRTSIYGNLHSSISGTWADPTQWTYNYFGYANEPFAFSGMTYGANSATGTVTTGSDTGGSSLSITLQEEETDDWKITNVTVGGTPRIY